MNEDTWVVKITVLCDDGREFVMTDPPINPGKPHASSLLAWADEFVGHLSAPYGPITPQEIKIGVYKA